MQEVNKKLFNIIIVNWNSGNLLFNCIESIILNEKNANYEIIVVDNNSNDNSLLRVRKTKNIRFIKLDQNVGFAKACNIGASYSNSKYLLFLNPDTTIFNKTISNTIKFLDNFNKEVGIIGIKLLDSKKMISKTCSRFPTVINMISKIFNIQNLWPKFTSSLMLEFSGKDSRYVDQVIGAFFLVKKKLFDDLDGFDESFFVYYEEVDFSYRAYKRGYLSYYCADFSAFHEGGGCSSGNKPKRLFYNIRSKIIYAQKHFSLINFYLLTLSALIIEPLARLIEKIIKLKFQEINEIYYAYKYIYKWFIKYFLENF